MIKEDEDKYTQMGKRDKKIRNSKRFSQMIINKKTF